MGLGDVIQTICWAGFLVLCSWMLAEKWVVHGVVAPQLAAAYDDL